MRATCMKNGYFIISRPDAISEVAMERNLSSAFPEKKLKLHIQKRGHTTPFYPSTIHHSTREEPLAELAQQDATVLYEERGKHKTQDCRELDQDIQ